MSEGPDMEFNLLVNELANYSIRAPSVHACAPESDRAMKAE